MNLYFFLNRLLTLKMLSIFNAIVFLAKIIYSFATGFPGKHIEDWSIANNIANHGIYAEFYAIGPTAFKLPVYPLFISVFIKFFPNDFKEILVIIQHVFYFFIPVLVVKLGDKFGRRKAGILAAYFFIASPAYFLYSNTVEVTNIFIPIFLVWLLLFLDLWNQHATSVFKIFILGLLTALLALTQVVAVPIVLLLLMALFYFKKIKLNFFALLLATSFIAYSPWIIRNAVVFDKFIPTKTPFWQNIYTSFSEDNNILQPLKIISGEDTHAFFVKRSTETEFETEAQCKKETIELLKGKEELFFLKAAQNAFLLWYIPPRYFDDQSFTTLLGRKLPVFVWNVLLLFAMFYYYKKDKYIFGIASIVFLGFTVPYMIGHAANMRFKLDFEWFQYFLVALYICDRFLKVHKTETDVKKSDI